MKMKCDRCGNYAPIDSFKSIPGTNRLICEDCFEDVSQRITSKTSTSKQASTRISETNQYVPCSRCGQSYHASGLIFFSETGEYVCRRCFIQGRIQHSSERQRDAEAKADKRSEKKKLVELALTGDAYAQFSLGKRFEAQKPVEAIKWYSMAAAQGHPEARDRAACLEFERAKLFDVGKPHKKVSIAIKWYRQATEHGHVGAQMRLNEILSEKERRKAQEAARLARIANLEEEHERLLEELDAAQSEITYDYFSNDRDGHLISDRLWESETQDRLIAIENELKQLRSEK